MPILRSVNVLMLFVMCAALVGACTPVEEGDAVAPSPTTEPAAAAETEAAAPAAPEAEEDPLVGTTWAIADYTVTFEADGVVRFNSGSEGTWTRADDTITISVAGEETVIEVDGETLTHDGMALEQQ